MEVYLDNSATTKIDHEVMKKVNDSYDIYGNPSSLHSKGFEAEKIIGKAKGVISSFLKCQKDEIYFTSGGTEANNMAIIGYALKNRNKGKHLITSTIEHKSVLNAFKFLESLGFEVTYLEVDKNGFVNLEQLRESINDQTILVSIMHVNNETGVIQKIDKIKDILKNYGNTAFHVDGVQGFCKIKLNLNGIDMYSFSGHKIHAFKGVGGLYVKKGIKLQNIIYGGQQEKGLRPGTENVLGILSLSTAVEIAKDVIDDTHGRLKDYKKKLSELIEYNIDNITINSKNTNSYSPYILNISFKGIRGEVLLHDLESKGIFVSTGSACNSKSKEYSHVLEAMGLDDGDKEGAIRFSFSKFNNVDEVDYVFENLEQSVQFIRDIMKGR